VEPHALAGVSRSGLEDRLDLAAGPDAVLLGEVVPGNGSVPARSDG
jgi:hypothetical protein